MGAFFLYHNSEHVNIKAVQEIFNRNEFQPAKIFELENYKLLLYRKQLLDVDNYVIDGDASIFCIGTPVYRGLSYKTTLQTSLSEFRKGILDPKKFLGNYCLIFYQNQKISFLIDELSSQHIFINRTLRRVSSSFLAILTSYDKKLHLNKPAFYEKVTTGFITGPDTLVEEITQVIPQARIELFSQDIQFINNNFDDQSNFHNQGIDRSIDLQIQALTHYFLDISALSTDYKTEIGLSGGYDSRLLYGLCKNLPVKISAYTHATAGIHDRETEIVKQLVKSRDTPLTTIPTKPAWQYAGYELEKLLKDCMYFFDGRSGYDMSTFSPVYTRSYRVNVMGENRLILNGSGGEIYRNYSHSRQNKIDWQAWMKAHIYFPFINNIISEKELVLNINSFLTNKISSRLDIDFKNKIDYYAISRYYAEIRMPDSKSIYANSQNQLSFYLAPFIEKKIIRTAYRAIPYLGIAGNYESKMIETIDPEVTAIPLIYGFPLNNEPIMSKLLYWIKILTPDSLNNFRHSVMRNYLNDGSINLIRYQAMISNCGYMQKINELLCSCFPEIGWTELAYNNLAIGMITNIGTFLLEFESHLQL